METDVAVLSHPTPRMAFRIVKPYVPTIQVTAVLEKLVEFAEEKMDDSSSLLQIVVTRCAGSIYLAPQTVSVDEGASQARCLPDWAGGQGLNNNRIPTFRDGPSELCFFSLKNMAIVRSKSVFATPPFSQFPPRHLYGGVWGNVHTRGGFSRSGETPYGKREHPLKHFVLIPTRSFCLNCSGSRRLPPDGTFQPQP